MSKLGPDDILIKKSQDFFDKNSAAAQLHGPAHPLVVALAVMLDTDEDEKLRTWAWYEKNIVSMLRNIGADEGKCRGCGQDIFWLTHKKSDKKAPYTIQALNHFANCPKAKDFKKGEHHA